MDRRKAFIVVNPVAANGRVAKQWPLVQDYLKGLDVPFDFALTERRHHATQLTRDALDRGFDLLVAYGGDGTLLEVLNGLLTDPAVTPQATLGIIPGGTGSDFVRTLGIAHDYKVACRRLVEGSERLVDVGQVSFVDFQDQPQRLYFANVAGLGFDGEVVERVERSSKSMGGTIPYLTNLFITLAAYRNKNIILKFDSVTQDRRLNSVIVCNGQYFGGAMFIAPPAELTDGEFDLVLLGDLTKPELVANVPRVYRGTHLTHPKVEIYRAREIHVETNDRMLLQADGELIGRAPATFTVLPSILRVIA